MGWYLRKALNLGPLRINLSKSGIGLSAGVKGLRVGTGPRGRYLHAGREGLYYRKSLNSEPQPGGDAGFQEVPTEESDSALSEVAEVPTTDQLAAARWARINARSKELGSGGSNEIKRSFLNGFLSTFLGGWLRGR